ncbi:MAG: chemotaxis protein CheA [Nitrospirae bacterium]|nr:chemotaxis protein CheA [Nitrospirota bacterium]
MSVDLSKFQTAFFEESAEHVATMEEGLLQLEQQPSDLDLLNRIFRAAHSIKGNAGMFGFTAVGEFTHKMENILDALRNGQMDVTKPLIDLLLEATDGLKGLLEAARTDAAPDEAIVGPLRERLAACGIRGQAPARGLSQPGTVPLPAPEPVPARRYAIHWAPDPAVFARGLHPSQIVRELRSLGELTSAVDLDHLPTLEALDADGRALSLSFTLETEHSRDDVEDVFLFVCDDSELTITEDREASPRRGVRRHGVVATDATDAETRDVHDEREPRNTDPSVRRSAFSAHRSEGEAHKLIGEILLEEGAISPDVLRQALSQQKRLGEILVEQQAATPQQIAQALDKQQKLAQAAPAKKAESASIRVDTEKIDKLINLVGELVITQSMLSDLGARFDMDKLPVLSERLAQLERNTREIQERVMAVRMLPIGTAFNRFPRLVRDLATKNGKQIQLVMSGEDTELDKTVIESIGDPLTHLVRNSADHGLEPPDERAASGKPEQGAITLHAFHEGGSICITVADDGRGLNRDKILAKALQQGLISDTDKLTDEQIWPLIFRPGFSTADKVTDVSGRGVGMDVVKRNIEALGGTVSIRTEAGKGTTFTLKLPLTLAIIDGLTVRVGPETYIVPLLSVIESIQPKPASVKTVVGRGEVLNVRGAYLPVMRLAEVFGVKPDITDPAQAILVILETEGERVAVMVDELLGQQQVVIKSLEKNFQKVAGLAGATILGDGAVAFILDVRGLIELARHGAAVAA